MRLCLHGHGSDQHARRPSRCSTVSSYSCSPTHSPRCRASTRRRWPTSRRSRAAGPTCPRTTASSGGCRCRLLAGTSWRATCSRATSFGCTRRTREASAPREQSTCCRRARSRFRLAPHPLAPHYPIPFRPRSPAHAPARPPSIEERASPLAAAGGLRQPAPPRHRAGRGAA